MNHLLHYSDTTLRDCKRLSCVKCGFKIVLDLKVVPGTFKLKIYFTSYEIYHKFFPACTISDEDYKMRELLK